MSAVAGPESGVRWTGRAYLLLATGAALAMVALIARTPVALFVGLPLLIAPLATASLVPRSGPSADLTWAAGGEAASVEVEGTLHGSFGSGAANLVVEVVPPPGAIVARPVRIERGPESVRFAVAWRLREPTVSRVPAPEVLWRDPLGLCELPVGGARPELPLERYPAELHRLGPIRLDRTIAAPGETQSRRLGRSGEFHGIREAAPDEPWGRINWRASARFGRLLANEFQVDLTGDLLILLDVRACSGDRQLDERLLGIARAAVFGIADSVLHSKLRVGYASFGEFLDAVPLSAGRGHRARVLAAITSSRLSPVAAPAERCAHSLRRYYRPGVTTLVFSSWTGEPSEGLAPYLRRQGFPPLLVSPSALPLLRPSTKLGREDEALARRLQVLDRRARLAETWRYGPVIDWDDYWSLEGLARFLRRPMRRGVA